MMLQSAVTRPTLVIFAGIFFNLLQSVHGRAGIKIHESAKLPKSVYKRIIETRKMMGGEAHVFPITGK